MIRTRMLYRHPGPYPIHNDKFDYKIIDESDLDKYLNDGWFMTTAEAKAGKHSNVDQESETKSYSDLSDNEKITIGSSPKSIRTIMDEYNVSYHTVRRCRSELD